jgi:hypothetical protein
MDCFAVGRTEIEFVVARLFVETRANLTDSLHPSGSQPVVGCVSEGVTDRVYNRASRSEAIRRGLSRLCNREAFVERHRDFGSVFIFARIIVFFFGRRQLLELSDPNVGPSREYFLFA